MRGKQRNSYFELLRAVSAMAVMIYHTEGAKWFLGVSGLFTSVPFKRYWPATFGPFLVLSIFMLVRERLSLKDIPLKHLVIKRVSRIYPLYLFMSFLGIFVLPAFVGFGNFVFPEKDLISIVLLTLSLNPEVIQILFGEILFINVFWFLGIQEKIYFLLLFLNKFMQQRITGILFSFLFATIVVRYYVLTNNSSEFLGRIMAIFPIEYGFLGGIFAVLYPSLKDYKILNHKFFSILILFLLIISLRLHHEIHFLSHTYFGLLLSLLMVNLNTRSWQNKSINLLGKYTYSFYSVHIIFVIMLLNLTYHKQKTFSFIEELFLYIGIISLSSFSSVLLYHFIERRFFTKTAKGSVSL